MDVGNHNYVRSIPVSYSPVPVSQVIQQSQPVIQLSTEDLKQVSRYKILIILKKYI